MKARLLMKALLLMSIVVFVTALLTVGGCGETTTLTVSTDHLPAGGGPVTVTYKTSGYLSTVGFTLVSNPPLSGFPIPWTGNMSGSVTPTITRTTTFTISNVPGGTTVTSKTVSVP
jgi:hypothetical protein